MPSQKTNLNVVADAPDLRDRYYEPHLKPLKPFMHPPGNLTILDQGNEGACTGFGLAATINLLYRQQNKTERVSPGMLYHQARRLIDGLVRIMKVQAVVVPLRGGKTPVYALKVWI